MARSYNFDIETTSSDLQGASPHMRWAFIRKVYCLLCIQLLLTFGVAMAMFLSHPVRDFMQTTAGFWVLIAIAVVAIIWTTDPNIIEIKCSYWCFAVATFIHAITFFFSSSPWHWHVWLGLLAVNTKGENVLLAAGLTIVITVGLTLFTFVAAWRGWDFNFLGPFLFGALLLVTAFSFFRIFFHVGKVGEQVIACIGTLVFSGYIIYDTDNLIKRFNYDQYIEAAISLYLDIINLFLQLLALCSESD
ncbi:hypothetical protein OROHE_003121 [Orobanche hederae]